MVGVRDGSDLLGVVVGLGVGRRVLGDKVGRDKEGDRVGLTVGIGQLPASYSQSGLLQGLSQTLFRRWAKVHPGAQSGMMVNVWMDFSASLQGLNRRYAPENFSMVVPLAGVVELRSQNPCSPVRLHSITVRHCDELEASTS